MFYTAYMLCLCGLLGVTITGDAFNLFVFLEISSLSSYVLIAMGKDRRALTASYQYLVLGTIGATFIVIGIGLLYAETGTLNMADLAKRLADQSLSRTIRRCLWIPGRRHFVETRALPAASLVTERLYLRAISGQCLSRRDGDQGRGLRPASLPVHGL